MDNQTTPAGVAIESTPLLAPCPFCGNVPKMLMRTTCYNELRFVIACAGPCEMKEVSTGPYQRQDECIAAWNGRANMVLSGQTGGTCGTAKDGLTVGGGGNAATGAIKPSPSGDLLGVLGHGGWKTGG